MLRSGHVCFLRRINGARIAVPYGDASRIEERRIHEMGREAKKGAPVFPMEEPWWQKIYHMPLYRWRSNGGHPWSSIGT